MTPSLFLRLWITLGLLFCLGTLSVCIEKSGSETSATLNVQQLPPEAQGTLTLIHQGGPFPYRQDGTVFSNREKRLPAKSKGHYHEYTVPTPGAQDRGARRIVCGGKIPTTPDLCYYTFDHYQSFKPIQHETAQP